MSYRKYDSRVSQRYLNQNLIVSLTEDFLEIGPLISVHLFMRFLQQFTRIRMYDSGMNNNTKDSVSGTVVMAEPLRAFTQFT